MKNIFKKRKRINEKELRAQEIMWDRQKKLIERQQKLHEEKKSLLHKNKKITTTKFLIGFLFVNCTLIEIFTAWVIIKSIDLSTYTGISPDFTPLTALIGAVVSEVMGFAIYAAKSAKENSFGGIVYDKALADFNQSTDLYADYCDNTYNNNEPLG